MNRQSMTTIRKVLSGLTLTLAFILAFIPGVSVKAGIEEIPSYESTWAIQPDGDVQVEETIVFDIGSSINGFFFDVDTSSERELPQDQRFAVDIDNVSVAILENGTEREVYMAEEGAGREGYFEFFEESRDIYRFKVYEAMRNETRIIKFRYTLENVITKYDDVAVLNWNMIGSNWEVPLNNVKMTITVPEGASETDLRIFSHGDLTGFNEIIDDRTFHVEIPLVEPGGRIENRVVFPRELVPLSNKTINRTELPTILEEEGRFAEEANREREEARRQVEEYQRQQEALRAKRAQGRRLTPFILGAGGLGIAAMAYIFSKYGRNRKPNFDGEYYRELPGDYTPAVMSKLMFNHVDTKDIMATLLDLARKRIIRIDPYTNEERGLFRTREETDYRLTSIADSDAQLDELTPHEHFLYDWFIKDLGDGDSITLDNLEKTLKKESNARLFTRDYDAFKSMIDDEARKLHFREANDTTGSGKFYILAALLAAFGGFSILNYQNILGVVPIIAAILIFIANVSMTFRKRLTQYGSDQTAMWKGFKNFLLHFSNLDKAEIPSLAIWNHYLVYATSLGVAKEVIDQLPVVFSEAELNDPRMAGTFYPGFYYGPGFTSMNRTLNNAVSTASQTISRAEAVASSRSSSSSGGGGGFSGGFSGGGGGGGGGGTF